MLRHLVLFILFIPSAFGGDFSFRLALIDSYLCPSALEQSLKQKITNLEELIKAEPEGCQQLELEKHSAFHGHRVLRVILEKISAKNSLTIQHHNVYDQTGRQQFPLWAKALDDLQKMTPQLVVSAVGGLPSELFQQELTELESGPPWLIAGGQLGPGVVPETKLWPHELIRKEDAKLLLVGVDHQAQLYQDKLAFKLAASTLSPDDLSGSSLAVSLVAAQAIESCAQSLDQLKECLLRSFSRD